MAPASPTRREVFIVVFLLSVLWFFSNPTQPGIIIENITSATTANVPTQSETLGNGSSPSATRFLEAHKAQPLDTMISWGSGTPPETTVVSHVPGWTVFEKLYIYKGIPYIITKTPEAVPDIQFIISKGVPIHSSKVDDPERLPTEADLKVVSPSEAKAIFGGSSAQVLDGNSFLVNDPPQFITHYYHWSAELWFGFWRTYSSLDPSISEQGNTTLPPLRRLFFNHLDNHHWRDYANMNQWVLRSSFPSVALEFVDEWRDRAEMGRPFVFERVVLADRSASMQSYNYQRYQRSAGPAFALPGSMNWWQPIRNNVVEFAGVSADIGSGTMRTPVITYISRQQWGRRMLIPEHHEKLVSELYRLRDEYGYEVNIVNAESMTRLEQIQLAARTTIMMGVHGNGLTSLVWMNPNPRSTVMEFFYPEGFAHDYEYTTRALGMTHYGFWNNQHFTSPGLPLPKYVEGFQGNAIPIDGEVVAALCVHLLSLNSEVDD